MSEKIFYISIVIVFAIAALLDCILEAISNHSQTKKRLQQVEQELLEIKDIYRDVEEENQTLRIECEKLKIKYPRARQQYSSLLERLSFDLPAFDWKNQDDVSRLHNALRENIEANCESITAIFVSQSPGRKGTRYITTLTSCSCKDRDNHPTKPCKHMFALALKMNVGVSPLRTPSKDMVRKEDTIGTTHPQNRRSVYPRLR